jgi:hypothetical protein
MMEIDQRKNELATYKQRLLEKAKEANKDLKDEDI